MKALIVDDHKEDRQILKLNLEWHGYTVIEAANGQEALELAQQQRPDCIISDALMPVMDGFQLLREINKLPEFHDVPFVFYSSVYTGEREEQLALSLGARAFITKPKDANQFWEALTHILQKAAFARTSEAQAVAPSDDKFLNEYSRIVAAKLEEKVRELQGANQRIFQSEARYRNLFLSLRDTVLIADFSRTVLDANQPALRDTFGYQTEELVGKSAALLYADSVEFEKAGREVFAQQNMPAGKLLEIKFRRKSGEVFDGELYALKMRDDTGTPVGNIAVIRDITLQKKLRAQLLQAQKMESVGRLAGGVAHDFNNMLSVIIGYAELALERLEPSNPLHQDLQQIYDAGKRSADITRQLLAFARKQTIVPRVLNLNETIEDMLKMLRRLIGEDINLAWLPAIGLGHVKLDPSQMDQMLANLCVNARDAISGVGKVTLETGMVTFDESYCVNHQGFIPGDFVFFAVSDDGCGIKKEALRLIFEPFYTTKEMGKGTGLGLATVYGIVKQNNGFINVYSEPDKGTTFHIYLPVHKLDVEQQLKKTAAGTPAGHGEIILIVEDEIAVLKMSKNMLEKLGYTVLTANTPAEAIKLVETHLGNINVLITDVVMPEMNGRDLAGRLNALYPDIKTLFMSGYTANVIAHRGILDEGVHFIHKPFSVQELATKVREALGRS